MPSRLVVCSNLGSISQLDAKFDTGTRPPARVFEGALLVLVRLDSLRVRGEVAAEPLAQRVKLSRGDELELHPGIIPIGFRLRHSPKSKGNRPGLAGSVAGMFSIHKKRLALVLTSSFFLAM
jgi:hypothetical protein